MKAWKHQEAALSFAEGRDAAYLALGMGCGKSKVAIDLFLAASCERVLVLCPSAVVPVWPQEIAKHAGRHVNVYAVNRAKSVSHRAGVMEGVGSVARSPFVAIVNYDCAWRSPMAETILRMDFDMVILDEAHRTKSPSSKVSWFVKRLGPKIGRRLCLSGTPMPHSPLDLYAQFRFLKPDVFGTSFQRFKMRYARMGGYEGRQVIGYQNLDELNEKFYEHAFRVTSEEALDLPPIIDETIPVELSEGTRRIYNQMKDEFMAEVKGGVVTADNALTKLLRLQQITSGYLVDGGIEFGTEKQQVLESLLEDIGADEPVVVFCRFKHDLESVHKGASKVGRKSIELSGSRHEISGVWQKGHDTVAAVQIQSGKEGIDLTRAAYVVYYSLGFSLGDYEQSRKRSHRPGQGRTVRYYHLAATNSVDGYVMRALQERADIVAEVLGDLRSGKDLDI